MHAVLWLPLILLVTLGPLRPMKGLMIALQYHHKAAEEPLRRRRALSAARQKQKNGGRGSACSFRRCSPSRSLIALGTWQVERKAWKEGLIATLAERLAAPPTPLPPPAAWTALDPAGNEYRRVTFKAEFEPAEQALVLATASAFRPDVTGPGYWVFAPARLAGGGVVVVNHGFVPLADVKTLLNRVNPRTVDITGTMRWPEAPNWFTPKADLAHYHIFRCFCSITFSSFSPSINAELSTSVDPIEVCKTH